MQIYNTLTRKKENFKSIKDKRVGLYTCGPTVYDYDHIGHSWNYFNSDILRRVLEYLGYKVKHVMNITDVGHLTSDSDEGEDKLEKSAKKEKKKPKEIAEFYTKIYLANRKKMNLLAPNIICKATEHIKEMIALNKKLVANGFAYEAKDALYFDITKFPNYGQLSGNTLEQLKAGSRIEVNPNKKNPFDFALWMKAIGKHKNHILVWNSPWGKGFPGWHIECSAMSMKYLGEHFDIHTGGEDNIFPHHECEIAQSESATGKKFVNYWTHTRFLMVNGCKMSKSLNNFYRLQDLEEKNFKPMVLRYLFLTTHYRSQLNFTWESLEAAQTALERLYNFMRQEKVVDKLVTQGFSPDKYKERFNKYISDDFNMPKALSVVWDVIKSNLDYKTKKELILDFDKVLGLNLDNPPKSEKIEIPNEIKKLIKQREKARQDKNWDEADALRHKIEEAGFSVEDSDKGSVIKRLSH